MSGWVSECDALESLIARLADEFVEQLQRGESPDVDSYVARWPGDPRVVRQVLTSLELVRLSSASEAGAAALETVGAAARLGDFQLLRELGRGGMGVVYEAEQLSLGRRVALKILPFAGMLDPRQRQRFQNEAQAAAQLDHPNIINVIAVGCERGVYYYAMRLVEGPTLADVVRQMRDARGGPKFPQGVAELAAWSRAPADDGDTTLTRSPDTPHDVAADGRLLLRESNATFAERKATMAAPQTAGDGRTQASTWASRSGAGFCRCVAQVGLQVARALDFAHDVGIVHRDIKPSNLMVDCHGTVWITDFGLARVEANPELTMTGDLLGTLRYMSPEQITGQRAAVDHRTDIYALGATLYELLTGRPAFAGGQRAELLRRIATEPPAAPRKLNRSVPVELETIVLKALEKNPLDRYRTAGEMADDLQRFLDNRPILARRSPVLGCAKAFWRRHQVLLLAVLITLLVATTVGSLLVWRQWREAVAQRGLVVARDADLRQRLYAADIKLAHQAWQRGDLARMKELLDRYSGPAGDDLREFAWHYLSSLLSARPAPLNILRPGHGNIYCVQFSSDGRHLAAACGDGHVNIWNVPDWSLRHSLAAHQPADADCVAFSPDGKRLVSGGEDGWLRLWDVETGELKQSLDAGQKDTLTVAISPDGQTLASGGIDGLVRLWRLPEGERRGDYRASSGRVQHLAFSPDGRRLATAGGDSTAIIVDATTCNRLVSLPGQSIAAFAVAFSAKGDQLALGSGSGLVSLVDASAGHAEFQFGIRPAQVRAVAFSPSRRLLASAGLSGAVDLWNTATRSLAAKLQGHERRIWSLCFSPDGKLLASGGDDGSVHVWDPNVESGMIEVENAEPIYRLKFAQGGGSLLTATDRQELVAWNPATLDRLAACRLPDPRTHELAFSPDRRTFAVRTIEGFIWLGQTAGGGLDAFDPGLRAPVTKIALARDARLLAWYADGVLDVWDTASKTLLDRRQVGRPASSAAAISQEGRWVATPCDQVAGPNDRAILLYDAQALAARFMQTSRVQDVYAVALSPDQRWLAAAWEDGPIGFVDIATGEAEFALTGHQHRVDSMAFSPDGRTLASAGHGGAVRLWHIVTREELFVVRRLDSNSDVHLDFSPDGRRLAAATSDRGAHGRVFIWSTATSDAVPRKPGDSQSAP